MTARDPSTGPAPVVVSLTVNGERVQRLVPPNRSLLDLLREDLGLTGSKHGCDVGDCGACTVLVDGVPSLSCVRLAAEVDGAELTTVEGLAGPGGRLSALQQALHRQVASQCGYCTPGIAVAVTALLEEDPRPTDAAVREVLAANICRCTGYTRILAAVREVIDGAGGTAGDDTAEEAP